MGTVEFPARPDLARDRIAEILRATFEYAETDPGTALNHARKTAEAICTVIFSQEISTSFQELSLDESLKQLKKQGILPRKTLIAMETVKNYGNFGSHYQDGEPVVGLADARPCLLALVQVTEWFYQDYLGVEVPEEFSEIDLQVLLPRAGEQEAAAPGDSDSFSDPIKKEFHRINKTIEKLTTEQFALIQTLKGEKRVLVSGCAGSGKTLIAAEKCIRLDRAGLKTLLLCHNPLLADYIRRLVKGTGVLVYDFYEWLDSYTTAGIIRCDAWSHHEEPTEQELVKAFEVITNSADKYDAIVVDEGQDFRDTWWLLVEAALENTSASTLYIFCDDNQALLPHRSNYPIKKSPHIFSRNCRNAGVILDKVRRLYPQAPETSVFLAGKGEFHLTEITRESVDDAVEMAVRQSLQYVCASELTVLTMEQEPVEDSVINKKKITVSSNRWQSLIDLYAYPDALKKDPADRWYTWN
jgi:hypothetical protein